MANTADYRDCAGSYPDDEQGFLKPCPLRYECQRYAWFKHPSLVIGNSLRAAPAFDEDTSSCNIRVDLAQ